MNPQENEAVELRKLYLDVKRKYYTKDFLIKLAVLSEVNPEYYFQKREIIKHITALCENLIIREEYDRAVKYIVCLQIFLNNLNMKISGDIDNLLREMKFY